MKKFLLYLVWIFVTLNAQTFKVTNQWQLLGVRDDFDSSVFDGSCADTIWSYKNGQWKLHISNYQNYQIPNGITLTSILRKDEGFWIKGGDCSQDLTGFTAYMLAGKTVHEIYEDHLVSDPN